MRNITELTVTEARDRIEQVFDLCYLRELKAQESSSSTRKSVMVAIANQSIFARRDPLVAIVSQKIFSRLRCTPDIDIPDITEFTEAEVEHLIAGTGYRENDIPEREWNGSRKLRRFHTPHYTEAEAKEYIDEKWPDKGFDAYGQRIPYSGEERALLARILELGFGYPSAGWSRWLRKPSAGYSRWVRKGTNFVRLTAGSTGPWFRRAHMYALEGNGRALRGTVKLLEMFREEFKDGIPGLYSQHYGSGLYIEHGDPIIYGDLIEELEDLLFEDQYRRINEHVLSGCAKRGWPSDVAKDEMGWLKEICEGELVDASHPFPDWLPHAPNWFSGSVEEFWLRMTLASLEIHGHEKALLSTCEKRGHSRPVAKMAIRLTMSDFLRDCCANEDGRYYDSVAERFVTVQFDALLKHVLDEVIVSLHLNENGIVVDKNGIVLDALTGFTGNRLPAPQPR